MKTLIVECKLVIEIPWDMEPKYSTEDHIRFVIEENSCPGTGSVGSALEDLIEVADKNDICWGCAVGGQNKLIAIEDRAPRDYYGEIEFNESEHVEKCHCGSPMTVKVRKNASIEERWSACAKCGGSSFSMDGVI